MKTLTGLLVILLTLLLSASAAPAGAQPAAPTVEDCRKLAEDVAKDLKSIRKLTLDPMPPVQVVTRDYFVEEYTLKTFDFMWGGDFDKTLTLFKALGLVPAEMQAKPFLRKYGAVTTAAAYDFLQKRILFPGTEVARDVLLHELVHAAQDQNHDIRKMCLESGPDLDHILAIGSLFEGEALNVQLRYSMGSSRLLAGVTPYGTVREQARAQYEKIRQNIMRWLPEVPPNFISAQGFVYDEGVLFVEALRRRARDWKDVDLAYKMPPRSTTQILHPEKYIAGEWPLAVTLANKEKLVPGDRLSAENTIGEFGMRLFLSTHQPNLAAPEKVVEGWRGDRVLLYLGNKADDAVVVWASTWESAAKASAVAAALNGCEGSPALGRDRHICAAAKGSDVVAVISYRTDVDALLAAGVIKTKTIEGRPLGDQEEKAAE